MDRMQCHMLPISIHKKEGHYPSIVIRVLDAVFQVVEGTEDFSLEGFLEPHIPEAVRDSSVL